MATANFPTSIWSGLTGNHVHTYDDIDPNMVDWRQSVAEIIAAQTQLRQLIGATDLPNLAPSPTKGTDPNPVKISDYMQIVTKDIIFALAGAAANQAIGYTIPAGAMVLGVAVNIESDITLVTGVAIGLGVTGSIHKYGVLAAATKNTKVTSSIAPTPGSGDALKLYSLDNSNLAAGTLASGSVRIRLTYAIQLDLPDAP